MNKNPLKKIVKLQKEGFPVGIYSACSANEYVIRAVLSKAKRENSVALIESTANQVDQFGGYTGMKPIDFKNFVMSIATEYQLDDNQVFLGGDHLGPLTWSSMDEESAMLNAEELIRQYVLAGFTKIHVDTSMKLASDDPNQRLSDQTIADRGAKLVKVANEAYQDLLKINPDAIELVFVVGSEVPIPGGAQEDTPSLQITTTEDFKNTVATFKNAFLDYGIEDSWNDVIAVVVQPGVEEKASGCTEYDRSKAAHLKQAISEYTSLVFEGHSTDYQTQYKLKEMVEDSIAILKVGPALTFALREALFSLSLIEDEVFYGDDIKTSDFINVLETAMQNDPSKWNKYYHGDAKSLRLKRKYSFSDRARYYLPLEQIGSSIQTLITNLDSLPEIPLNLLSQYMPIQYTKVRNHQINNDAKSLLMDRITNTLDEYTYATHQQDLNN